MENRYSRDMPEAKGYNSKNYSATDRTKEPLVPGTMMAETVKGVRDIARKIPELLVPSEPVPHISFILEGVRTNGGLRRSSGLSQILSELDGYVAALQRVKREAQFCEELATEARGILTEFYTLCPACQGAQGELQGPNSWDDCPACDGYGMVPH